MMTSAISCGPITFQSIEVKTLATTAKAAIAAVKTTKAMRIHRVNMESQVSGGAGMDRSSLPQSTQNKAFRAFAWPRGQSLTLYVRPQYGQ